VRKAYGPVKGKELWKMRTNKEIKRYLRARQFKIYKNLSA